MKTKLIKFFAALLVLPFVGGCVTTGDPRENQDKSSVSIFDSLSEGMRKREKIEQDLAKIPPRILKTLPAKIDRSVFGPMHVGSDFVFYNCKNVLLPNGERCPLGESIAQALGADTWFINSGTVIDPELDRLGLRSHFKAPAGENMPEVQVMANKQQIDFLMHYPKVTLAETAAAANAYCGSLKKNAHYVGVSVACVHPDKSELAAAAAATKLLGKKGSKNVVYPWNTMGLAAYNCVDARAKSPARSSAAVKVSAPFAQQVDPQAPCESAEWKRFEKVRSKKFARIVSDDDGYGHTYHLYKPISFYSFETRRLYEFAEGGQSISEAYFKRDTLEAKKQLLQQLVEKMGLKLGADGEYSRKTRAGELRAGIGKTGLVFVGCYGE
jgi:hypothetical protein